MLLLVVLLCWAVDGIQCRTDVYIGGLLPHQLKPNDEFDGAGVVPAISLAQSHVNERTDILRNYTLKIQINDTKCDMATGTKAFFDQIHFSPQKLMIFGASCSLVASSIGLTSKYFELAMVSYANTDPEMSSRENYPYLFRTVPSDTEHNYARIALLQQYNWTRVGTLYQDVARFSLTHNHLVNLLDKAGVEVAASESFTPNSKDIQGRLKTLKDKDVRIILANFETSAARLVFCEVYHLKMFGERFQWILFGQFNKNWWDVYLASNSENCTNEQVTEAIEGAFTTSILEVSTNDVPTVSNLTPSGYLNQYSEVEKQHLTAFHGYAYDGIWVVALALHQVQQWKPLTQFRYYDPEWRKMIVAALNATDFVGVTGMVRFRDGDRIGSVKVQQFQNTHLDGYANKVGEFDAHSMTLSLSRGRLYGDTPIVWRSTGPAKDRTIIENKVVTIRMVVLLPMCAIACVGIALSFFFLGFNLRFRNHHFIKMSSPQMNNIIIVGCIFSFVAVIFLGLDANTLPSGALVSICTTRAWILCLGFTFAFGAMFAKTWRVHAIFTNLSKKVIKDFQLLVIVLVLLLIDAVILITWQVVDPLKKELQILKAVVTADRQINPYLEYCSSDRKALWLGLIFFYKGLLLVFGIFLAWETRQLTLPALNDSKYIGLSVYNVTLMCIIGLAISFLIDDQIEAGFILISIFIMFSTTLTLCLVFMPKVLQVRRDPEGRDRRARATLKSLNKKAAPTNAEDKHRRLQDDNQRLRRTLRMHDETIETLENRVKDLGIDVNSVVPQAEKRRVSRSRFLVPPKRKQLSSSDESGVSLSSKEEPTNSSENRPMLRSLHLESISSSDAKEVSSEEKHSEVFCGNAESRSPPSPGVDDRVALLHPRTPSYQGLKQLCQGSVEEFESLRETSILSDAETESGIHASVSAIRPSRKPHCDSSTSESAPRRTAVGRTGHRQPYDVIEYI